MPPMAQMHRRSSWRTGRLSTCSTRSLSRQTTTSSLGCHQIRSTSASCGEEAPIRQLACAHSTKRWNRRFVGAPVPYMALLNLPRTTTAVRESCGPKRTSATRAHIDSWCCMTLATQQKAGKHLKLSIIDGSRLLKRCCAPCVLPGRPSKCLRFRFHSTNKVCRSGQAALLDHCSFPTTTGFVVTTTKLRVRRGKAETPRKSMNT